jgi:hypothetical protein
MAPQDDNDTVLHQDEHEAIIEEAIDGVEEENEAIPDLVDISGGQSPTEVEHNAVVATVNGILAALRSSHIIPPSEED